MVQLVFEYLDHKSDIYVHSISETLEGVFRDAVVATFEVMLDTKSVRSTKTLKVNLVADDLEQLLYVWVDRLLYLFDAEGFAASNTEIESLKSNGQASITATLFGEDYEPSIHGQRSGVKAMTYSLMRIGRRNGNWEAYFVLDI